MTMLNGSIYKGRKLEIETAVKKGQNPFKDQRVENDSNVDVGLKPRSTRVDDGQPRRVIQSSFAVDDEGTQSVRKSMHLLIFGAPSDSNKKSFSKIIKKVSRKTEVQLMKEVSI